MEASNIASQQSNFDELNALSLLCDDSQRLQRVASGISVEMSGTIDDFLYGYRPKKQHIQALIGHPQPKCSYNIVESHFSSLSDDLSTSARQDQIIGIIVGGNMSSHANVPVSRPDKIGMMVHDSIFIRQDSSSVLQPEVSVMKRSKCPRKRLSEESRAERRREQNREAQRRFREKQMFPHRPLNAFSRPDWS
jgi:hypothetical protein